MAIKQIIQHILRHELPYLPHGKVTTSYVENGIEENNNHNGFM
jgi:hypothetical protein